MNTVSYILCGVLLGLSVACFIFRKFLAPGKGFIPIRVGFGFYAAAISIIFFPNMKGVGLAFLIASLILHNLTIFAHPALRIFLVLVQLTTLFCVQGSLTCVPSAFFGIGWALVALVGFIGFGRDLFRDSPL